MTTHESSYGRDPITVNELVPTRSIEHRLARTHVGTPDEAVKLEVLAAVAVAELTDDRWTSELADAAVAYALWCHAENGAEYRYVMGGIS